MSKIGELNRAMCELLGVDNIDDLDDMTVREAVERLDTTKRESPERYSKAKSTVATTLLETTEEVERKKREFQDKFKKTTEEHGRVAGIITAVADAMKIDNKVESFIIAVETDERVILSSKCSLKWYNKVDKVVREELDKA